LIAVGWGDRRDTQFMSRDQAHGENIVFAATGISVLSTDEGRGVRGSRAKT